MPIEFNCPSCFKGYRVADSNVGKRVKCKDCGAAMTVPDMSGLSFADDETGQHRKPARRHSSTKILPADRPMKSLSSGAKIQRNIPSDTARLEPKPGKSASQSKTATRMPPPEPKVAEPPAGKLPPGKLPTGLKSPPKLKGGATRARPMPEIPRTRLINFVLLIGVAAMIVGFFLPWFTLQVEGFTDPVAGFQIPLLAADFAKALEAAGYGENALVQALLGAEAKIFVVFILYLVPAIGLFGLINDWRCAAKGKSHWWIRWLVFLAPALCGAGVYFTFREGFDAWFSAGGPASLPVEPMDAVLAVGPGAWAFVGGWLFTLLAIFIAPRVKKPQAATPEPEPTPEEDDVPDISAHTRPTGQKKR